MLRAIIVDDEELACKGLKMRLEQLDQVEVVESCRSGRQALDAIVEHEPDLLFLDIQMPGMTGFEAHAESRKSAISVISLFMRLLPLLMGTNEPGK